MDKEAILALARAAQASQRSLEAFIEECFGKARDPVGAGPRVPTPMGSSSVVAAGRAAADLPRQGAGQLPYAALPASAELTYEYYIALAGGVIHYDVDRTLRAMRDFLNAVHEVWRPTVVRIIGTLLKQPVLVSGEQALIAYRVHFGTLIAERWGVTRAELARQALIIEKRGFSNAAQCQLIMSFVLVTVAVVICIIVMVVNTSTTAPMMLFSAVAATDAMLVSAIVIVLMVGFAIADVATTFLTLLGFRDAARVARLLCKACKSAGMVTAAILVSLVSVLINTVYVTGYVAQVALGLIVQDLMAISVQTEAIVAALRANRVSEADVAKAIADKQGKTAALANAIAKALKDAGSSFEVIAKALKDAGFSTHALGDALAAAFGWSTMVVQNMLRSLRL